MLVALNEPRSYKEAMNSNEAAQWKIAIEEELNNMTKQMSGRLSIERKQLQSLSQRHGTSEESWTNMVTYRNTKRDFAREETFKERSRTERRMHRWHRAT